jgi:hypothetical protein
MADLDDDPFDPEAPPDTRGGSGNGHGRERERESRGFVTEFVRKVAVTGLGALFMTEEGLRALAGQLKLPKELLGVILSQAEKTKSEIGRIVSEEIRRFLQSDRLRDEVLKLVSQMTIEVKAEIRLKPDDPAGSTLEVKDVTARRAPAKKGHKA